METGLTYYDIMLDEISHLPKNENKNPVVLVAPTWKEYSIINRFGTDFFDALLNNSNYNIILRPHPQSYVSFPKVISDIEKKFVNEARFSIDNNRLGTESMAKADLMISDLSGVIWDFAFLYSKPVLLLKTNFDDILGFEGSELNYEMWEVKERKRLGKIFDENDVSNISDIVNDLISNPPEMQLSDLKDESVFNFGKAGEVAAYQIITIVDNIHLDDNKGGQE